MGTILGDMFKKVGGGLGKVFAPMNRRVGGRVAGALPMNRRGGGRGPERC